ncbi:MAG: hypothetical protein Q7U78_09470 [Gallionella sp.]|nr:hypothetical protein [Gallionella sp.]
MIEKSPAKRVNIMVWPFLEARRNGLQARFVSFAGAFSCWIPAFAGMTKLMDYLGLIHTPSGLSADIAFK